mgnify:CR=1 FL=1
MHTPLLLHPSWRTNISYREAAASSAASVRVSRQSVLILARVSNTLLLAKPQSFLLQSFPSFLSAIACMASISSAAVSNMRATSRMLPAPNLFINFAVLAPLSHLSDKVPLLPPEATQTIVPRANTFDVTPSPDASQSIGIGSYSKTRLFVIPIPLFTDPARSFY